MIEFKEILLELQHRLDGIAALAGARCVWKVSERMLPEPDLPRRCYIHDHPFCSAAKVEPGGERRCVANDTGQIPERMRSGTQPFVNFCHAGAAEVIVPIHGCGNECMGAAMIGPFRTERPGCPAELAGQFATLPPFDPERAAALMEFVPEILGDAIRRAYAESPGLLGARPRDERILRILDELRRNFRESPSATRAAELVFMSPSRFIHLFKSECGLGYSEYLLKLKLREARRYLLGGEWPISFVAFNSGFVDQSYFSAVFRREYGLPPLAYRKKFSRGRTLV